MFIAFKWGKLQYRSYIILTAINVFKKDSKQFHLVQISEFVKEMNSVKKHIIIRIVISGFIFAVQSMSVNYIRISVYNMVVYNFLFVIIFNLI